MEKEKREIKGYKIKNSVYLKAKKKAKVVPLATLIETFVTAYAAGATITMESKSATTIIKS